MRNRQAFTLIELLVVIAIIAILAAILFPVFAQAKLSAKKAADISNFKQMGLAVAMYSADVDDMAAPWQMPGTATECPTGGSIYWPGLLQPYVKNTQIFLSPTYQFEYDLNAEANGTPWVCRQRTPNIVNNRLMRVSYLMNGIETTVWDGTPWKDAATNHHGFQVFWDSPTHLTGTSEGQVSLPANTIRIISGHTYGDAWGARFTDFLHYRNLWDWTGTGKEWSGRKAEIHGIYAGGVGVLWADGHAGTKRWGTTIPSDWSVQDDRDQDPWAN